MNSWIRDRCKTAIRRFLRARRLDIVPYAGTQKSLPNILEMAVQSQLLERPEFFFVQVGANDGSRDDPMCELVRRHELKGLLIEPLPDMFERLKLNYQDSPQLMFENAAVSRKSGLQPIYRVKPGTQVPDWLHGSASFNRSLLARHTDAMGLPDVIEELQVPALGLAELLSRHHVDACDLLLIDTEGYDFEVLKMAFEIGLRPALIYFEHVHLSVDDIDESQNALVAAGYRFMQCGINTLAVLEKQS